MVKLQPKTTPSWLTQTGTAPTPLSTADAEEIPPTAPPELVTELENNIGPPPDIVDPSTDMREAMQFTNLNMFTWSQTIKGYFGIP